LCYTAQCYRRSPVTTHHDSIMISSGIAPLDERLGGLVPGRAYVLSGAPGTGKSVACLEFLAAGLKVGERAVMITHDDPSDLLSQAQFLGIDIESALADERIILLRYQLDFVRRYGRAPSVDVVFEELRKLIGPQTPARLVIDSVAPFLEGGPASGAGLNGLLEFITALGSTSLLTYPGDVASSYDRRLETLVQRAAGIFHLTADPDRTGNLEIRKVRFQVPSTAPIRYRIRPGLGIVALADERQRRAGDASLVGQQKVLVLDLSQGFPKEFLQAMENRYDVNVRSGVIKAFGELASGVGAVLIDVRRDSIRDVLTLIRELRKSAHRAPILLVTQYRIRSDDRARALRAGADDFIAADRHPDEFLVRLEAALRRGHAAIPQVPDEPLVLQPNEGGELRPLDEIEFGRALGEHLAREHAPFFTIVTVTPRTAPVDALARVALQTVRADAGDLVGMDGTRAFVFLQSARRRDVEPFVARVQERARQSGLGELDVDTATCPGDEERIRDLMGAAAGHGTDAV
jgi:KaiC/GvpD/RAD55 family RecA-like ATPase/DNA-binding NarL/FixJ family response regulator